ncbi:hypothetical protein LCGC14_2807780, partial [marine sediment metagenome]
MELYTYMEHLGDALRIRHIMANTLFRDVVSPIIWAQEGRYGWISKEQVQNLYRRQRDLEKQQKGYAKDKPIDLAFHWDEVTPLDPAT